LGEKVSPKQKDFVFGIILTHLFITKGEDSTSQALMIPFLAIHAKGGESMSPKQKDRTTTTNFKNLVLSKSIYQLVSYCVQKEEKSSFSKMYIKTLLNTKRWISFRGSFVKSKEKHLKQGEKISNLENALQNPIHLPLTICKRTLKRIYKRVCKNKTCGASVVQNVI
jgi:hypothetical protein